MEKKKTFLLKAIPADIYKMILERQLELTLEKNRKVNIEHVIYALIREAIVKS